MEGKGSDLEKGDRWERDNNRGREKKRGVGRKEYRWG